MVIVMRVNHVHPETGWPTESSSGDEIPLLRVITIRYFCVCDDIVKYLIVQD